MAPTELKPGIIRVFVETLSAEIGAETFKAVLSKSDLPREWADVMPFLSMDGAQMAQAYARLQSALRTYYGRGARGILMRIGSKMWKPLLESAPVGVRTQASLLRGLPKNLRRKQALEVLAKMLSAGRSELTVHTLDLDLLFVDQASPTAKGQSEEAPVCFVTFGLIRECLFWAVGEEHDIEERACCAVGARQCEFKITIGVQK